MNRVRRLLFEWFANNSRHPPVARPERKECMADGDHVRVLERAPAGCMVGAKITHCEPPVEDTLVHRSNKTVTGSATESQVAVYCTDVSLIYNMAWGASSFPRTKMGAAPVRSR